MTDKDKIDYILIGIAIGMGIGFMIACFIVFPPHKLHF
mgnify:CR=1 FL=1